MQQRIVIHTGFHKTGTSSVQAVLRENRKRLRPVTLVQLPLKVRPLINAARGFSTWRDPFSLLTFRARFGVFLKELPDLDGRGLLVSAESLAGHMPGRANICDYSAAIELAQETVDAVTRAYLSIDVHLVYTVRDRQSWLRSAYWEHVKATSITVDFDAFCESLTDGGAFDPVLDRIKEAVAPHNVHEIRLEDWTENRLGPAEPVLKIAGVSDDMLADLIPKPRANTGKGHDVLIEMLTINRTISDPTQCREMKAAILKRPNKG